MNMLSPIQIEAKLVDARNGDPQWRARRDKLETLLRFMTSLTPAQVCLDTYMTEIYSETGRHCGSAGCLAGWACVAHPFMAAGLSVHRDNGAPAYGGSGGNVALARFFDVALYVAECLFDSTNFSTLDRTLLEEMGVKIQRHVLEEFDEVHYDPLNEVHHHKLAIARLRYALASDDRGELGFWHQTQLFGAGDEGKGTAWAGLLLEETVAEAKEKGAVVFGNAD